MKRILGFAFACVMIFALMLTGCGNKNQQQSPSPGMTQTPSGTSNAPGGVVRTGLGSVISIADSTSATADAAAVTQANVTMAAVTLAVDGRIAGVKIDMVQSKISFDAQGQLVTDPAAEVKTKVELGDEYGMKTASAIDKEWFEQIAALEDWMIGKTPDEIMGMKMTEEGTPDEADLTASVTIHVADYLNAVKKAADNAKDYGAMVTGATKTGLGNVVLIAKSTSAAADAPGLGQTDDVMVAVTLDESGKIVGVMIDAAQVMINVNAQGQVTSDTAAPLKTKVELGDEYGMKSASGIGKEWFEQIAALSQWMVGKTVDEVSGLKTTAEGTPDEADLTSSVTIHVADYISALQKAAANAD